MRPALSRPLRRPMLGRPPVRTTIAAALDGLDTEHENYETKPISNLIPLCDYYAPLAPRRVCAM